MNCPEKSEVIPFLEFIYLHCSLCYCYVATVKHIPVFHTSVKKGPYSGLPGVCP